MKIKGLEAKTPAEIDFELQRGARFVHYEYCFSVILVTYKEPSAVYFIKPGESRFRKGLLYTGLSLLLGWWGIPWGPIYTITSLVTNFRGGKDVTPEVVAALSSGGFETAPSGEVRPPAP